MLVFRSVGFSGGWKTREPRHLTLGVRINVKLTIEPGPQWGEVSALTTSPYLLPKCQFRPFFKKN